MSHDILMKTEENLLPQIFKYESILCCDVEYLIGFLFSSLKKIPMKKDKHLMEKYVFTVRVSVSRKIEE